MEAPCLHCDLDVFSKNLQTWFSTIFCFICNYTYETGNEKWWSSFLVIVMHAVVYNTKSNMPFKTHWLYFSFYFDSTGLWTYCLTLARQVHYLLSHPSSSIWHYLLQVGSMFLPSADLRLEHSYVCLPTDLWIQMYITIVD
jgi:hypothetical protein